MDTDSAPFEVVFRGAEDGSDSVQFHDLGASTSTNMSDLSTRILPEERYQNNMATENISTSPIHNRAHEEDSPLRETHSDPFKKPRWWREASSLSIIIASMIVFCVGITIALIIQIIVGSPQLVPHAGVLSDDAECSELGLKVLAESLNKRLSDYPTVSSVDAAILTSLCLMIKNVHKGGLGGGGFMLIEKQHDVAKDTVWINFREMSPVATDDTLSVSKDQVTSGLSIAVPGFIKGLQLAHKKFGKENWKNLFLKAASLAADGVGVTEELEEAISELDLSTIPQDLKNLVTKDDNVTPLTKNDTLKQPALADTLKILADNPDSFYNGELAESLVNTVSDMGSKMTTSDLSKYEAEYSDETLRVKYGKMDIVATGVPSSGPVLLSTLNLLSKDQSKNNVSSDNLMYHRMLEALKFSYGYQTGWENCSQVNASLTSTTTLAEIDDAKSFPIEHYLNGTQPLQLNTGGEQHVTVIGNDRLVVTIVMGIGSEFGSKVMSSGYILNNAMLDFSWPGKNGANADLEPSQANMITGGKRPISSMATAIVLPNNTKCGLYLGFDAHTGPDAISALTQTIIRAGDGESISKSIQDGRITQNMNPYGVGAEANVSPELVNFLNTLGHNITNTTKSIGSCSALSYYEGLIAFYPDFRDDEDAARKF